MSNLPKCNDHAIFITSFLGVDFGNGFRPTSELDAYEDDSDELELEDY